MVNIKEELEKIEDSCNVLSVCSVNDCQRIKFTKYKDTKSTIDEEFKVTASNGGITTVSLTSNHGNETHEIVFFDDKIARIVCKKW